MAFLDAVNASTHCRVRGSAVVRPGWALIDAEHYLRSLPVEVIKAQAVRVSADDPFALSDAEKSRYMDDLETVAEMVIDELEQGKIPRDDRFSNRVLQLLTGRSRRSFCGAGSTTFGFTPEGAVLPCVLLDVRENYLGHVDEEPENWLAAGAHWRGSRPQRTECNICDAAPLCGGGCPAIIPVCGADECEIIRQNCAMARKIYQRFRDRPEDLLPLAGIT
jgi:radical SAM protein with 4Fe4S-binding SPASM domain